MSPLRNPYDFSKEERTEKFQHRSTTKTSLLIQTNLDALECRLSAISLGYWKDDYTLLWHDSNKPMPRKSPLINRGSFLRYWSIQKHVETFLDQFPNGQIVNLGAGSDMRYFQLSEQYRTGKRAAFRKYIELDLPSIIAQKIKFLHKHRDVLNLPIGTFPEMNQLQKPTEYHYKKGGYHLFACDFRESDLSVILNHLSTSDPVLFISECVLMYLPTDKSNSLIQFTKEKFEQCFWINYEPIEPNDPFGETMLKNLQDRGIFLQSIKEYPNKKAQEERWQKFGFKEIQTKTLLELEEELLSECQKYEILDENEEWQLLAQHYLLLTCHS